MAYRMQQRRGTASQWTTADPILAAGEIGFETDTGEFRVGDGTNHWSSLSPFKNLSDLGGSLDDYVPVSILAQPNGVATLDADGNIYLGQLANIINNAPEILDTFGEVSQVLTDINGTIETTNIQTISDLTNLINTTVTGAAGDAETYADNAAATARDAAISSAATAADSKIDTHNSDTTNVHGIADTSALATKDYADNAVSTHSSDTTSVHGIADTADLATKTYADSAVSTAVTGLTKSSVGLANVDNTSDANKPVSTATQTELDLKAPKANPTFTGTVNAADVTLSGNLTVGGTTTTVNAANLNITDPMIYMGDGNSSNVSDLGIVSAFNDGTYQHTGLVRDASAGTWKLFKGVTDEPTTTVNFAQGSLDDLALGTLTAGSATVGTAATFNGTVTVSASGIAFTDGTQVKQGVPSLTTINQQAGAYTPVLTDRDKLVEVSSASGVTVTIPTNASVAYPVGTSIDILQTGAGQVTIAGAGGVTVNATPGLKLRTQWSSATLFKRAADTWVVFGDLTA